MSTITGSKPQSSVLQHAQKTTQFGKTYTSLLCCILYIVGVEPRRESQEVIGDCMDMHLYAMKCYTRDYIWSFVCFVLV